MANDKQRQQPRVGYKIQAADGQLYEFWIDEFQRRWWRSIEDPSKLMAYTVPEEPEPRAPYQPPMDSWTRAIHEPTDFSKW